MVSVKDLTLEEKAALCSGADFWHTKGVERLGIKPIMVADGPHGLRKQEDQGDHVGIGTSVPATCFPPAVTLASTWNEAMLHQVGQALGKETRRHKVSVLLGPGANMKRTPLCGRNFEYFSEDPTLAGILGAAYVKGVQEQGVGTSLKHYAANNQETDRMRISSNICEQALRQTYLAQFERIVTQAQPWTVMCSYNRINGVYGSQHHQLLTQILREEWGFKGVVVSDWGAVADRVAALAAGLDLEMPAGDGRTDQLIVEAVKSGQLDEKILDATAQRMLDLIAKGNKTLNEDASGADSAGAATGAGFPCDPKTQSEVALRAAEAGTVLLRNEGGLLPLNKDTKVAVIGEFARTPRYQGAGSSQINPTQLTCALDEIRKLSAAEQVSFAPGFPLDASGQDQGLRKEAVGSAQDADVILAFLGLPSASESEGYDRDGIELPAGQLQLLDELAELGKPIVVILANGAIVELASWHQKVDAILEGWLGGQMGGRALARILYGEASPAGHLPESIPVKLSDFASTLNFPGAGGQVDYGEGVFIGYRGLLAQQIPALYPFGFGLSYTKFSFSDFQFTWDQGAGTANPNHPDTVLAHASIKITNSGDRAGRGLVQLYGRVEEGSLNQKVDRLFAFAGADLEPGESKTLTLELTVRDLRYFEPGLGWVLPGGNWIFRAGEHAEDTGLALRVGLDRPAPVLPLHANSTISEWVNHPVGGPLLMELAGDKAEVQFSKETLDLIGSAPLVRFAAFPNTPYSVADVEALLAKVNAEA